MKKTDSKDTAQREFLYKPNENHEHVMLSFFTLEREYYEKGTAWFITASIFAFISIIYFILDGAITSAIVFVLILTVLFLFGNKPPKIVEVHITHKGIYINRIFFHFKDINSYWIINDVEHNVHAMYFNVGKAVTRTYSIQLVDIPDNEIRRAIQKNIKEDFDKEEPGHYKFCRILRL